MAFSHDRPCVHFQPIEGTIIKSKPLETIGGKTTGSVSHTMVGFVKGGEL